MLNFVAIIFVFSVIVIIHELGHFLAARWMGVRVEKFSIGFPPSVFSKKIGQTIFSIGAIPLGGFVKMAGFIDESMDTNATGASDEFNSKPVWRRIVIITAGVIMNLILAIIIMATLNYVQGEKIYPYTTVGWVGENGIAEKIGFEVGDKIISINGKEIQTWNELGRQFIEDLGSNIVFTVNRDGKVLELQYKKAWFSEEKSEQLDIAPMFPAKVGDVSPDMPAAKLGLQKGDRILSFAGQPVKNWNDMTEVIQKHPDEKVSIKWLRNGKEYTGTIIPKEYEVNNSGETEKSETGTDVKKIGKIGIGQYYEFKKVGIITAVSNGVENTYDLIALNIKGIYWVLSGMKKAEDILGGPITIAKMAGQAAHAGWTSLLELIAAISAIIAFFNILPIPALDGGHLFFLMVEGIMGRPLSTKSRVRIQQIGMAVLLTLIVFILYVDLNRIFF
ncbi:MAG: RIP metalloprotease RseP [Calditrichaceae bacterium]|jgi:regulator of sigma E protease